MLVIVFYAFKFYVNLVINRLYKLFTFNPTSWA